MTGSYVMLNAQDAQQLNVAEGQILSVQLTDGALTATGTYRYTADSRANRSAAGYAGISPVLAGAAVNLQRWHNEQAGLHLGINRCAD